MTTDQIARFNVLLEDIQTQVRAVAEATTANTAALVRVETRLEAVETKVDRLEIKVDVLETHAVNTNHRLDRIESRLDLNGAPKQKRKPARKR